MTSTIVSRMPAATLLGAVVTTVVVLLMQVLIETDGQMRLEEAPLGTLEFLPLIRETPPPVVDRKPVEPPKPFTPPSVQPPQGTNDFGRGTPIEVLPPVALHRGGPVLHPLTDGDALPVVKVRPVYPRRAQEKGIEGYVLVQFTIDELGRVVDVQVLEAEPRGTFERAALEAVERFRYKPRVVNGEPVPVSGVKHLVTFELG